MAFTKVVGPGIHTQSNINSHNINSTGIITATRFDGPFSSLNVTGVTTFAGDVSIGGTLTYEDVTNVDSIGIVTARTGLVSPYADIDDFVDVGSNIQLGNAGVVTATSFVGSGADINGDLDVDGHTNLDNTSIVGVATVTGNVNVANGDIIFMHSNHKIQNGSSAATLNIQGGASNPGGKIELRGGTSDNNIIFLTSDGSGNSVEKLRIHHNGNIGVNSTSPTSKLDVVGDAKITGVVTATTFVGSLTGNVTGEASQVTIGNGANNKIVTATGTNTLGCDANFSFDGNVMQLGQSGAGGALYIHGDTINNPGGRDAKVWIEDPTSNDWAIHINKPSHNYGIQMSMADGASHAFYIIGGGGERFRITASGEVIVREKITHLNDGDTQIKFPAADTISFETNNNERLRVDSSGRLLYGLTTSTRETSLILQGNSNSYTTNPGVLELRVGQVPSAQSSLGSLVFGCTGDKIGGTINAIADNADWSSGSSHPTALRFFTTPASSTTQAERLRITREGYLFIRDNGVQQTNTTLSYQSEGAFITHYVARTTAGGDRYRRMLDIASVGANPHGSSIRLLTSPDSTNPAVTVERVRIDHNGRVGINKSTPQTMLSIKAERSAVPRFGIDGHYSDSSYTQCTWDDSNGLYTLLGVNHKLDANGNDATAVSSLHSASILLDGRGGNIRFLTKEDGGQTAPSERLRIKQTEIDTYNEVGINVNGGNANHTYDAVLYAGRTNNADWSIKAQSPGLDYGFISHVGSGAAYALAAYDGSNFRFRVRGDGVIFASNTTIQSISDVRLKENIVDANSQWDDIKALRFRNFNWKSDSGLGDGKTYLGLIAQEVEQISPNLIDLDAQSKEDIENGVPDPEHKSVKYSIVWMKAAKALQEAMTRIEKLEQENIALRARVTNLEGE